MNFSITCVYLGGQIILAQSSCVCRILGDMKHISCLLLASNKVRYISHCDFRLCKVILLRSLHFYVTLLPHLSSLASQKLQDENSQRWPIVSFCRLNTGSVGKVHKCILNPTTVVLSQESALTKSNSKNTSAPPTQHPTAPKTSTKFAKGTSLF